MAFLTNIEYKYADKVVAVSKYSAEEARSYYHLARDKVISIYNGVNLPDLNVRSVEDQCARHILFVGRLIWRKGARYLIDAIPQVLIEFKDTQIKIVGSGEQKPFLEERARQLGIDKSVQFLGNVSAEDLASLYSEADIYVQPSLYEPLAITVLEAMSNGKPIVASRVGGIPELVTSGVEGLLVEPENAFQLGEAITNLFSDSTLRRKYGRNARRKVETGFTWTKIAQQTLNLYEDLLSKQ
jgi:glycosyltransferase involved in cell wall biosynthesis